MSNSKIGVILLAAGASERLGKPKQLLPYKGNTLLQHVLNAITTVIGQPVVMVLGARAEQIQQVMGKVAVEIVVNDKWAEGMASSIRCGVSAITKLQPAIEGAIIMVCDQPYVSPGLLNALLDKRLTTGKKIIASTYNQSTGVPVLFDTTFFPDLLSLEGQEGAKKILRLQQHEIATVDFPNGHIDIDTIEDYEKLNND